MKFLFSFLWIFSTVSFASIHQTIHSIEKQSGGRIGISAIDTNNHHVINYRSTERFPLCSTFKVIGVAAILKSSMKEHSLLKRKIHYTTTDLVDYSPITTQHVHNGMTVSDLCQATITTSDNTAINLLMRLLGGPSAVTDFARTIGDKQFHLTRWEPGLNSAIPSETQDTTTPLAMRKSLQKLLLGTVLMPTQQQLLQHWLTDNTTGNLRIRAGVPLHWIVADKTGTGQYGTTNDIGVIYPPRCHPIVLAIYFTQNERNAPANDAIIALAAKTVLDEFGKTNLCLKH